MKTNKIAIIGLSGQSIFMNVDEFHKEGETKQVKHINIEPGGKGYNQAVACKKMGAEVNYLSSIGKDDYGKQCEKYLNNLGVCCSFKQKEENTALATILTNQFGDNQVSVYSGASKLLNLQDLETFKQKIKTSDVLLVQNEIPYDVLKEAIIYAHNNGVYVILNPAPAVYNIEELIEYIDLLIPNEIEANTIYNKKIEEIEIKSKIKLIITLGSKGCIYIDKSNKKYYDAKKVNVIDTTGAGDVFCGSIATFINKLPIDEVIEIAINASALHIQNKYVLNAIPTFEQVNSEIKKCK